VTQARPIIQGKMPLKTGQSISYEIFHFIIQILHHIFSTTI